MCSILESPNRRNLEDFALSICIVQNEWAPRPQGEPDLPAIETMAKGVIIAHDINVKAAFEVVLHMRRNLQTKIAGTSGTIRLMSSPEILRVAKNAMELLKPIFQPYSRRLSQLDEIGLTELGRRIAGVFRRDLIVNAYTGSGIHFTGLTRLYYDRTRLNKLESFKMLIGWGYQDEKAVYYSQSFPELMEVEQVVAAVMGPPIP